MIKTSTRISNPSRDVFAFALNWISTNCPTSYWFKFFITQFDYCCFDYEFHKKKITSGIIELYLIILLLLQVASNYSSWNTILLILNFINTVNRQQRYEKRMLSLTNYALWRLKKTRKSIHLPNSFFSVTFCFIKYIKLKLVGLTNKSKISKLTNHFLISIIIFIIAIVILWVFYLN